MKDFLKSFFSFSWAMSLFGVRQLATILAPDLSESSTASAAFESVANAAERQLNENLKSIFAITGNSRDGQVSATPNESGSPVAVTSSQNPTSHKNQSNNLPKVSVHSGRLNTSSFVVLGEGLAAGMGDFVLSDETAKESFPAQMARQMGAPFVQPLIQPPGIGNAI